jgi:hypothetical protein
VSKYDLTSHINFNTKVIAAEWQTDCQLYTITIQDTSSGVRTITQAHILISAHGILHIPKMLSIPWSRCFQRATLPFHSSQWDTFLDLSGKQVAIIGNGRFSVQTRSDASGRRMSDLSLVASRGDRDQDGSFRPLQPLMEMKATKTENPQNNNWDLRPLPSRPNPTSNIILPNNIISCPISSVWSSRVRNCLWRQHTYLVSRSHFLRYFSYPISLL